MWAKTAENSTTIAREPLISRREGLSPAPQLGGRQIRAPRMDEDEGRSAGLREQGTVGFIEPMGRQPGPGGTVGGLQGGARPVDDRDGDQGGDVAPMLPAMEAREIVGPHNPNETHPRAALRQPGDGVIGVACADLRLEARDHDARMVSQRMGGRHACAKGRQTIVFLERIAGGHQPPDLVEAEPGERDGADEPMPLMGRIEGPAEEADPHARRVARQTHGSTPASGGGRRDEGPSSYAHFRQNDGSGASAQGGCGAKWSRVRGGAVYESISQGEKVA